MADDRSNQSLPADYSIPGLRIQRYDPPVVWALVIKCAERQEDWRVYEPPEPFDPVKVDTTIHYAGRDYRIHEEEETATGWVYRMKPWPRGEPSGAVLFLSTEKVAQRKAEKTEFRRMMIQVKVAPYYEILLGVLPARVQERLAERWNFSPEDATRKSGLIEALVCAALTSVATVQMMAGAYLGGGRGAANSGLVFCAMMVEGFIRYAHALAAQEPMGLFALELAHFVYRRVRALVVGRKRGDE